MSEKMRIAVAPMAFLLFLFAIAGFSRSNVLYAAEAGTEITQIHFARGASSSDIHGAAIRGERSLYAIEAREGQRMAVRITSLEKNAVFQIYAPGATVERRDSILEVTGKSLPGVGEGDDATRWSGTLPQSGSYLLVVGSTRGNTDYRLTVSVR